MLVYGGAFIRWTEKLAKSETNEGKAEIEHAAEEIYVNETYVLWGQGEMSPLYSKDVISLFNPCYQILKKIFFQHLQAAEKTIKQRC